LKKAGADCSCNSAVYPWFDTVNKVSNQGSPFSSSFWSSSSSSSSSIFIFGLDRKRNEEEVDDEDEEEVEDKTKELHKT